MHGKSGRAAKGGREVGSYFSGFQEGEFGIRTHVNFFVNYEESGCLTKVNGIENRFPFTKYLGVDCKVIAFEDSEYFDL